MPGRFGRDWLRPRTACRFARVLDCGEKNGRKSFFSAQPSPGFTMLGYPSRLDVKHSSVTTSPAAPYSYAARLASTSAFSRLALSASSDTCVYISVVDMLECPSNF